MDKEQIKKELEPIFLEVFSLDRIEITDDLNAEKVDRWDSLTHLSMIAKVEDFFNVKFKLKELIAMKNVGDMIALIETKTNA
jgi:acyl carrier protein